MMGATVKTKGKAVYPGTFDPVTFGHLDVLKRAAELFDEVIISVSQSSSKESLFTVDERINLIKRSVGNLKNVRIESFEGLLVNYAKRRRAGVIIRGLRAVSDFEYNSRWLSPTAKSQAISKRFSSCLMKNILTLALPWSEK